MPLFEFECLECAEQFERLVRTADPSVECPSCGKSNVQRLISLCGMSSEATRSANLSAAHQRAAAKRTDKQRSEHAAHHHHFGDTAH